MTLKPQFSRSRGRRTFDAYLGGSACSAHILPHWSLSNFARKRGNVFCWALASHQAVVVPTDISEIRNLIHLLSLRDSVIMEPRLRKQVMHFARCAAAPTWSCKQILQWLIAEQSLAAENDLCGSETKRGRRAPALSVERGHKSLVPVVIRQDVAKHVVKSLHECSRVGL